jgi:predicted secreted protein
VRKMKEQNGVTTRKLVAGLIIAILVSCAVSAAVCPCVRAASMWSKTYGGTGADTGAGDIIQTSDGGYAISGDTASFGAGGTDYWLIKTDAAGNMQWNKTYGGSLAESEAAMCQTSDGGYALVGDTKSFGAGSNDFWLVKTDAAGNMQWNKTYGGTGADLGINVVQTGDGGYALAGYTNSFGAGSNDFWLIKTDDAGNMQWNKTYGGTGTDFCFNVIQTGDGGYALAGPTTSFGAGGMDIWLVKTDAAGNMLWNQTHGGTGTDYMDQMIQTVGGGYAIAGFTTSFGAGSADVWLVKTDASGNMQWNKTYGGTGSDNGFHMTQTLEGGYAIIGSTASFGAGGNDIWLVKTDTNGVMEWNQTYGGTGTDDGRSIIQTTDGGYALAGNTNSLGAGGNDFYVLKTDESGIVPEGLTIGVMLLLSTAAVIVSIRYFRNGQKSKTEPK